MPVKNVGSKLVRGVRQIKEHQDSPAVAVPENAPVVAEVKPASPRTSAKPAPAKSGKAEMQHPDRVWPD
ncbi:MAG: hypothetical protein WC426_04560 [Sulfuriferula sp.]